MLSALSSLLNMYQKVPKVCRQVGKDKADADCFITTIQALTSTRLEELMKNGLELEESVSALDSYESKEFIRSLGLQHFSDSSELSDLEDDGMTSDEDSVSMPLTPEEVKRMNRDKRIALADRLLDSYFLEKDLLDDAPSSTSASDSNDTKPAKPYYQPPTKTGGKSKTRQNVPTRINDRLFKVAFPDPKFMQRKLAIPNGGYVGDNRPKPPPELLPQTAQDQGGVAEGGITVGEAGLEAASTASASLTNLTNMTSSTSSTNSINSTNPTNKVGCLHDLQYYIDCGYKVVEWDGIETIPLLDDQDRIFMVLAGRPNSPEYVVACDDLYNFITDTLTMASANSKFPDELRHHKRGNYTTLDAGIAYSQGMTTLSNHSLVGVVQEAANTILSSDLVNRVQGHLDATHAKFAPKLHAFTRRYVRKVFKKSRFHRKLRRLNKQSFYVCASANSGSKALTTRHTDEMNLGFAWCGVLNVGDFDPLLGGHLVLEELRFVVQFPPNSAILLPSACIHHCNTTIQEAEKRAVLTFYNPGGMFRYIDNYCMTEKELWKQNRSHFVMIQMKKATRYQRALKLFSTLAELKDHIESLS
ncbi:hypothetical protein NP233_g11688 [Leucocoprinus birnbaumii]|uniref:Uncharacterized protein n=1 Tax=Leucocoprinus birnbaumii TaxID=56174 RepID=A0AAD5VHT7_9AGAR|nr:hypothetical protein NP233_g11688 [Leucocoprinus birnbaumii]